MLIDRLKPEIRSKHRGQLSKGIVLLHDNARPHIAAHTVETLQKLMFVVLAHPLYSPDLAPSDCHLFGPLKVALTFIVRRLISSSCPGYGVYIRQVFKLLRVVAYKHV